MKHMKKFMALFAVLALVLAMAVPAFADEPSSSSNTTQPVTKYWISVPSDSTHTYDIYQIFTGDYDETTGKLSNIKWGANGTGTVGEKVDDTTLNELAAVVNSASDRAKLDVIEKYADLTGTPVVSGLAPGQRVEVVGGYYLFKDKVATGEAENIYVTQVVKSVEITAKESDQPKFEKKLKDINDTTDTGYSDWQDVADHDIGDEVPFKLEATLPSDLDKYKTYSLTFHDVAENGLTFNENTIKVYLNGVQITAGYTFRLPESKPADGCTFEVVFDNVKDSTVGAKAGDKIRVEYTATLNENAVIGGEGNLNKAKLQFSNNPNTNGTGETAWDNVLVFTYKVVVNKYANEVDEAGKNKLTGAEFTLEKVLKDGSKKTITVVTSPDGTSFTFNGLDDGEYILTETKTPSGYNTIDPITFTVTADHETIWGGGDNRGAQLKDLTGNKVTGDITFTATKTDGQLTTNVINKSGTTLPSTGGIGTTIFYVVGGGLMVAAAVLLVAKKRMENK